MQKTNIESLDYKQAVFIRFVAVMSVLLACFGLGLEISLVARGASLDITTFFSEAFGLALCTYVIYLSFRDRNEFGGNLLLLAYVTVAVTASTLPVLLVGSILSGVAAAIIARRNSFIGVMTIVLGNYLYRFAIETDFPNFNLVGDSFDLMAGIAITIFASASVRYFIASAQTVSTINERSVLLLNATSEIGQITSKLLDQDELFNQSVELIRDRFAYYHVQIFLVDEAREYANLVASTGGAGRELLARKHRLPVGSRSVIGRVTQAGEVVVAGDSDANTGTIHARNELLPNTRSELALPLVDGEVVIGALDLQSTQSNAFNDLEIRTLQVMANQLGIAIRNARLFDAQKQSLQENKRLFIESETNLREIQRLNRQLSRDAWDEYLTQQADVTGVTFVGDRVSTNANWTKTMRQAAEERQPVIVQATNKTHLISVPILLRGDVMGVVEVQLPNYDNIAHQEVSEMLDAIANRLAVSLDSARLFEESQASNYQEQRINEIVGQFQSANTIEDLLQITLQEMTETLGAEQGAIRLGKADPTPDTNANGHTANGYHKNGGAPS